MSAFRGHPTCSPDQSAEQIRSHGRCVYVRTERAVERDGTSWVVFVHYGDWTNFEPYRGSLTSDDRS
ncbi:hypothetical protein LCL87_24030 [Rhodococcus hoagii]|nr:hypothetical protein [Prescottella equi]